MDVRVFMVLALGLLWSQQAECSYLGYPRLNFVGKFRADTNTRNNERCNYRMDQPLLNDTNADWGFNGTNEFEFFDTKITSVVFNDGNESTDDPVVGCKIVENLDKPFPKLTDLDVDVQDKSTIYGMRFGVNCQTDLPTSEKDAAFFGKWTRSVIAQDMWGRLKCYSRNNCGSELFQDSFPFGSQGTTFVTDVSWNELEDSRALDELKEALGTDGKLSVRFTVFYYTRNYPPYIAYNATLGNIVGTIGVAEPRDTLNFAGQRSLLPTNKVPFDIENSFGESDLCKDQDLSSYTPWMSKAPFELDEGRKEVRVDLSNSLPVDLTNSLRNLSKLQLGILRTLSSGMCVQLLGSEGIPYLMEGWLENTGGIYMFQLGDGELNLLKSSPLVVGQVVSSDKGATPTCGQFLSTGDQHSVQILLEETPYFIRPKDYYVDRLEYGESSSQTLYVTHFGQPASGIDVKIVQNTNVIPQNGVQPDQWTKETDSDGLVSFTFTVQEKIPYPRQYTVEQCDPKTNTLPIEGQVYTFKYCVYEAGSICEDYGDMDVSEIVYLAFSTLEYQEPYYWINDVKPILAQYARLSPVMNTILDMGNYGDVTKPWNIHLLNLSLRLDFEDPGHMPTSRDLSPTKRNMILKWLENPRYSPESESISIADLERPTCKHPVATSARSLSSAYFKPPRCLLKKIPFTEEPRESDTYFEDIFDNRDEMANMAARGKTRGRPLFGLREARNNIRNHVKKQFDNLVEKCDVSDLQDQLQTALQLEFATIPVYLTALYSIKDGCNRDIYSMIRSVVMQEMLHMTQAANTLIAVGGRPIIDSVEMAPSYPTTGLPGGVLPKLEVYINKLALDHVYNVFMGIETPQQTLVGGPIIQLNTIGEFYDEIKECINYLEENGDSPFDPTTVDKQVKWPWNATIDVGTVFPVYDSQSAIRGIEEVVTQGEGAGLVNPNDIANNSLAHFFKFEEIVCQRKLIKVDKHHYAYAGDRIPFDPIGVWPMRDEPDIEGIRSDTNCYTESRAFHHAYRALLRKLQEIFDGRTDEIEDAVELMETMQVHAKKLMWTRFRPNHPIIRRMCGPVWEYEWPDDS